MDDPGVRDRSRRWNSAFTEGIGGAIFGTGVLAADLAKAAGWASNLAVARVGHSLPGRSPLSTFDLAARWSLGVNTSPTTYSIRVEGHLDDH